ncbi:MULTISPECIES: winged helix-turn-helix domain-containing protein [unclassified Pseudoalteromonas]|uniref:winged helix-turn-helix domain-containing protein n=1 Tax=unclassified Pseudoalteromonas TaxID=194690 RepID=UPI0011086B64|nr:MULTISPECIES: winged helix-turn-helix domain-containing protein [unclassified Pseudoalteromonas]TMO44940.1 TolB protein [Pseudoalteromonas sp. S4389]
MARYRIGKFAIDESRCLISSQDYEQIVEPKVMDVLHTLYLNKGEVVSQEVIFAKVWPNATYNPSSVQRCIALLRKALQEDAKNPQYIITHPKRGYSLEKVTQGQSKKLKSQHLGLLFVLLVSLIAIAWQLVPKQQDNAHFTQLMPLTSSELNEANLSLSHSGKYLAFVRGNKGSQQIWIKELATEREVRLTEDAASYYALGWSNSDNAIAFVKSAEQKQYLNTLSIDLSKFQPLEQATVSVLNDTVVTSHHIDWHADKLLYYIEKDKLNNDTRLVSLNLESKQKAHLLAATQQDWLLVNALSKDGRKVAMGIEAGQNKYRIDVLDLASKKIQTIAIIENGIQGLSWHPNNQALLISQRNQLINLELDGELQLISFNNYQIIRDAQYTPDAEAILMELVNVDVDIVSQTRATPDKLTKLVDTSSIDFLPVFSPDSTKFVFESHRFGLKQLFLYDNGKQTRIFANPDNHELFGIVWSQDTRQVYTASKDTLFKIDLSSGTYETIPHGNHSFYLREMYHNQDAILVSYRAEDGQTFHPAKFDLTSLTLTPFTGSGKRLSCYGMDLDEQDQIYFSNSNEVFRVNSRGDIETVWQAANNDIIGISVSNQQLAVTMEHADTINFQRIDLATAATESWQLTQPKQHMLINSAHDLTEFLYLTEPNRTRKLVKLL